MKYIAPIKKWLKIKKISITNKLYKLIGTRVEVNDIVDDLLDIDDIWREVSILLGIWELTKFKDDILSINRLEACVRAFIKLKGGDWKCSHESLLGVIENIYTERIDLYDDSLFTDNGIEIQAIKGTRGDIAMYFLLIEYLFKKEIE